MCVRRTAAFPAFVLGTSLTECYTVRTGDADGHTLASLKLYFIRRLVIITVIRSYIVGISVLIIIELRQPDIQLGFESVQVHRVGIKDILIHNFLMVPRFCDMYFVGIRFLCLFAAAADDVTAHPVVDAVVVTVILTVELIHPASRPSRIAFRVGESLFPLRGIGIKAGVARLETSPLTAVQDTVVIRGRIIVTQ